MPGVDSKAPELGEGPAQVLGPAAEPEYGRRQIVAVSEPIPIYFLGGKGIMNIKTENCVVLPSQN